MSFVVPHTYVDGSPALASQVNANHEAARAYLNGGMASADFSNRIVDRARVPVGRFQPLASSAGGAWFESGDVYMFRQTRNDAQAYFVSSSLKMNEQDQAIRWSYVPNTGATFNCYQATAAKISITLEARVATNERYPISDIIIPTGARVEAGSVVAVQNNSNIISSSSTPVFEPGSSADYGGVFANAGGADASRYRLFVYTTRLPLDIGRNDFCVIINPNHERIAVRARSGYVEFMSPG